MNFYFYFLNQIYTNKTCKNTWPYGEQYLMALISWHIIIFGPHEFPSLFHLFNDSIIFPFPTPVYPFSPPWAKFQIYTTCIFLFACTFTKYVLLFCQHVIFKQHKWHYVTYVVQPLFFTLSDAFKSTLSTMVTSKWLL